MGKREEAIAQYARALALEPRRTDPEAIADAEAAIRNNYEAKALAAQID